MKYKQLMPMNLQYFAEGDGSGDNGDGQNNQGDNNQNQQHNGQGSNEPKEPEKKYSDADLDKIINQKFAKWQKDSDEKLRQSQLTAEEKEKERIAKLEKLERDVAARDAKDVARKALSEAKLPSEFADFVFDTQEDVAKEKMENFTKLLANYRESVVKEVLKDKTPDKPKQAGNTSYDVAKMSYQELAQLKEKDPETFKKITQ